MDQRALLEAKQQEITQQVTEWALNNLILSAGQRITVDVSIKVFTTAPAVRTEIRVTGLKTRQKISVSSDLTADDWTKILAVGWTSKTYPIIAHLSATKNSPMRVNFSYSVLNCVNVRFAKNGLDYRLRKHSGRHSWAESTVRLFKVR